MIKSSGINSHVEIDVAKVNNAMPSRPDTSIGCSMILSRGIPIALSVDKDVMFRISCLLQNAASKKLAYWSKHFRGFKVDFLGFSDGFKELVIPGKDIFMFVDLRSHEQKLIRASRINSQGEIDVVMVKNVVPLRHDTSLGCSMILSQGLPTALSVDKDTMFSEEPETISACLNFASQT